VISRRQASASLTFLGAAGTVTGSKFLLEAGPDRVLVDAGLFQGQREWRRRNWRPLDVDPASLGSVVLTHAHLDHSGYLPRLVREGFGGPVVCTPNTAALVAIVLRDAAHLQEEDAAYARHAGFSKHDPPLPLFDTDDVDRALKLLDPVPVDTERGLGAGRSVTLRSAGHILGSAFAEVHWGRHRITFSGDLGRSRHPLLRPPERPHPADTVVVESTYGRRRHHEGANEELAVAVNRTLDRGGAALLPAFAVDRTPMLLQVLADLIAAGEVPDVPVFVDSPMALTALEVYREAARAADPELRPEVLGRQVASVPPRLRLMATREASEQLNQPQEPCIIVSASGMATGGRVLHHLRHQLPDRRNSVILTGFQVPGTRGHSLVQGARHVKIHGEEVPVRAEVVSIDGFSAHADEDELLEWLGQMPPPRTAYVVHGEPDSSEALAERLRRRLGWNAVVPRYLERVRLG
jgi:metallo-beta-lactamase family protein